MIRIHDVVENMGGFCQGPMMAGAALTTKLMAIGSAVTAFSTIKSGMDAAAMGEAQQEIYNMQAQNAQKVADRNALIRSDEAKYNAERQREEAIQEGAASQRRAKEIRRQTNLKVSSAKARAGASGAGATDPTALDIYSDLEGDGEYNALTALYEGNSRASLLRSQANLTEYQGAQDAEMIRYGGQTDSDLMRYRGEVSAFEGNQKKSQSYLSAAGTGFSSAGKIAEYEGSRSIENKYKPKNKAG